MSFGNTSTYHRKKGRGIIRIYSHYGIEEYYTQGEFIFQNQLTGTKEIGLKTKEILTGDLGEIMRGTKK